MSNNRDVIQNQPDKLMHKAKLSAISQKERENQLMTLGWRWVKDTATRCHKLVPPAT